MSFQLSTYGDKYHQQAGEDTPLLVMVRHSRTPLEPSIEELGLYLDVAVGMDGKGGDAGRYRAATETTVCFLNWGGLIHLVALIPLIFIYVLHRNVPCNALFGLVALNTFCLAVCRVSETWQLRSMKTPATFLWHQRCAERSSTTVIVVVAIMVSIWLVVQAAATISNPVVILQFAKRESIWFLLLGSTIFIAALSVFIALSCCLLPRYRTLWSSSTQQQRLTGGAESFVRHSTKTKNKIA